MDDHERIWLQPWCADCEAGGADRLWCQDNVWTAGDACECGRPAVEYVRADLAKAETKEPAE